MSFVQLVGLHSSASPLVYRKRFLEHHDQSPDSRVWLIDNKYYRASVPLRVDGDDATDGEDQDAEVAALLLLFDSRETNAELLEEAQRALDAIGGAVELLAAVDVRDDDVAGDADDTIIESEADLGWWSEWLLQNGGELVRAHGDDELCGARRVGEMLSAHVWPQLERKAAPRRAKLSEAQPIF